MDSMRYDSLLVEANRLSECVYQANLEGKYEQALAYADSTLACLNRHFMKYADFVAPQLQLVGEGASVAIGGRGRVCRVGVVHL